MICPCCKHPKVCVYAGRNRGTSVKRYRKCPECGRRFVTIERYVVDDKIYMEEKKKNRKV